MFTSGDKEGSMKVKDPATGEWTITDADGNVSEKTCNKSEAEDEAA